MRGFKFQRIKPVKWIEDDDGTVNHSTTTGNQIVTSTWATAARNEAGGSINFQSWAQIVLGTERDYRSMWLATNADITTKLGMSRQLVVRNFFNQVTIENPYTYPIKLMPYLIRPRRDIANGRLVNEDPLRCLNITETTTPQAGTPQSNPPPYVNNGVYSMFMMGFTPFMSTQLCALYKVKPLAVMNLNAQESKTMTVRGKARRFTLLNLQGDEVPATGQTPSFGMHLFSKNHTKILVFRMIGVAGVEGGTFNNGFQPCPSVRYMPAMIATRILKRADLFIQNTGPGQMQTAVYDSFSSNAHTAGNQNVNPDGPCQARTVSTNPAAVVYPGNVTNTKLPMDLLVDGQIPTVPAGV